LVQGIVEFRKERFIRDCKEYLRRGIITDNLRMDIVNSSPGHLEYLKKGLVHDDKKIVDAVILKVKTMYQKKLSSNRQKVNIVASSVLENLSTLDEVFKIKEVMDRYRETINPVKALYYDLQEIMFLYDGKVKNEHHRFLIGKFSNVENFERILLAIDKDLEDLYECKSRVKIIRDEYGINSNSEYAVKVTDLHNEMQQWKKLFERFPDWVTENKDDTTRKSLFETLKDFFT
jgi:hypothetical protein